MRITTYQLGAMSFGSPKWIVRLLFFAGRAMGPWPHVVAPLI